MQSSRRISKVFSKNFQKSLSVPMSCRTPAVLAGGYADGLGPEDSFTFVLPTNYLFPPHDYLLPPTMNNLASTLSDRGKHDAAEETH
jgi:hypothetical protein